MHRRLRTSLLVPLFFVPLAPNGATRQALADQVDESILTPADVARIRSVASARMSPDGRHVAYVLSVPRPLMKGDDGPPRNELHVVDLEGVSRPYITGDADVSNVEWLPDSSGLAFTAKRGKDEFAALYVIPLAGGEARRVLKHDADIGAFALSPDGKQVAFLAGEKRDEAKKKRSDNGFTAIVYEEDFEPARVWRGTLDRDDLKACPYTLDGSASGVRWSPDGSRLAVALSPTPLIDDVMMNSRWHIIDAENGKVAARIDTQGKLGACAWSPDSKTLAIIAAADRNDPSTAALFVVPAAGGTPRNLLDGFEGHPDSIAWQDDRTIMVLADQGVSSSLSKLGLDGAARMVLLPPGGHVLAGLSLSRDGQSAACVASSASHPPEVVVTRHAAIEPKRLTDSNPWLAKKRLARQEVVEFTARDGQKLQGILIRPLNEQARVRPPLILNVHGGPEAHESNGWLTHYARPGQVAAARGFGVFFPNYRGSTGRGLSFSKMGQNDPGGKEFDDLIDAVDHLTRNDVFDAERVGVTGGSYGGYATGWCATRFSDRFKAAVMFVGISDLISKFGTTDIPQENHFVHQLDQPWDHWQKFLERSPVFHARSHRTPLLILHGKDDPRVNVGQSMELYRHLKLLKQAPVRLVLYPGEGHGNRKAAARYDYHLRMMQWFEHYLMGPGGDAPAAQIDVDGALPAASQPSEASKSGAHAPS